MPIFKMIGPVVSEIYHLPQLRTLGHPLHPRSPRGRAAGKKKPKLDPFQPSMFVIFIKLFH